MEGCVECGEGIHVEATSVSVAKEAFSIWSNNFISSNSVSGKALRLHSSVAVTIR